MAKISKLRPSWASSQLTKRVFAEEKRVLVQNWVGTIAGHTVIGLATAAAVKVELMQEPQIKICRILKQGQQPYSKARAFAFVEDNGSNPECWVRINEPEYRIIYHDFLTQFFNFPKDARLSGRYHVDHVFSRGRARRCFYKEGKYSYVRLTITKGFINIGFGRIFEKFSSLKDPSLRNFQYGRKEFYWPMAIKAFGLTPPNRKDFGDEYVVKTARRMNDAGIIPDSLLNSEYAGIRNAFLSGSTKPNIDNFFFFTTASGRKLCLSSPLKDWIDLAFL